jgi:hypothetical protein
MLLRITEPKLYFAPRDEDHFYEWLQQTAFIKKIEGIPGGVEATIEGEIEREELYELVALFRRYGLDPNELREICDEQTFGEAGEHRKVYPRKDVVIEDPLVRLEISQPKSYFSQRDANHFFGWLQETNFIKNVKGVHHSLFLTIEGEIEREELYNLIALFTRYQMDLRELRGLCEKHNNKWFRSKKVYWHEAMFKE